MEPDGNLAICLRQRIGQRNRRNEIGKQRARHNGKRRDLMAQLPASQLPRLFENRLPLSRARFKSFPNTPCKKYFHSDTSLAPFASDMSVFRAP